LFEAAAELARRVQFTGDPAYRLLNLQDKLGKVARSLFETTDHGRTLWAGHGEGSAADQADLRRSLGPGVLNTIWLSQRLGAGDPVAAAAEELAALRRRLETA